MGPAEGGAAATRWRCRRSRGWRAATFGDAVGMAPDYDGLPLGLSSAIGSVQTNVPRYVIASYLGPAMLARFAAICVHHDGRFISS